MEEKICFSVPLGEIAVKYMKPYVKQVWGISRDKGFVIDNMRSDTIIHELQVYDGSIREVIEAMEGVLGHPNLMYYDDHMTYGANPEAVDCPQIFELNCPLIHPGMDSIFKETIVSQVRSNGGKSLIQGLAGYDKRFIEYLKKGGGDVVKTGNHSLNINGVTFRKLKECLHVAYQDTAGSRKAAIKKKRDLAKYHKECADTVFHRLVYKVLERCENVVLRALEKHYESERPRGMKKCVTMKIINCDTLHRVAVLRSAVRKELGCSVSELLLKIIKSNKFKLRKRLVSGILPALIYFNTAHKQGALFKDLIDSDDEEYKALKHFWPAFEGVYSYSAKRRERTDFFYRSWSNEKPAQKYNYDMEKAYCCLSVIDDVDKQTRHLHLIGQSNEALRERLSEPFKVKYVNIRKEKKDGQ